MAFVFLVDLAVAVLCFGAEAASEYPICHHHPPALTDGPGVPNGTGVRIATDRDYGNLALDVVPGPVQGDAVVESSGAVLFLDRAAAEVLEGMTLDAATQDNGTVQFTVAEAAD